jgi:hypothetical protein
MSWGIDETGTKEEVLAKVGAWLDTQAKNYEKDEEGADVVAVKARVLAIVPTIDGEKVRVQVSGSRAWGDKGTTSQRFTLLIERV